MNIGKRFISLSLCCAFSLIATISVNADTVFDTATDKTAADDVYSGHLIGDPLSPGIRVLAYDNPLILSSSGDIVKFSAEVFDNYNRCVPSSIKILSVPESDTGTLIYDSKPVNSGQSISVLSLSSLYFDPIGAEKGNDAEFTFSPDNTNIMRCIIRQKDTENNPPSATDIGAVTTFTKLDTAVAGYLIGADPDGDNISYEIVSHPAKGIVSVNDEITGQFVYHPYKGMSGNDSFTYRIRDSYGAYSDVGTVNLTVEDCSSKVYSDTSGSYHISAVDDIVSAGIMQTQKTEDGEYFYPNDPVSRIDFLIMAMKSMGAGEAETVSSTPFSDDETLSDTEKGYLSAAYNLGIVKGAITDGKLTFMPDEAITGASAAVILNGILGLPEDNALIASSSDNSIPTWAAPAISALTKEGIINNHTAPANSYLTRENTAVILSQIIHEIS